MRRIGVPLIFLAVALAVFGGWYLTRRGTRVDGQPMSSQRGEEETRRQPGAVLEGTPSTGRSSVSWDEIAAGWNVPLEEAPTFGGVSSAVAELSGLCFGRSVRSTNTLETKQVVQKIVFELPGMDAEAQRRLAEFFRDATDPALKFWLTRAFSLAGGEPYVEAVADYYHADPNNVAEALQYMAGRSPKAIDALDDLYRQALDPVERENLIARMAFVGVRSAKEPLERAFASGGSDKRVALSGLAAIKDEGARALVWSVVDGEEEVVSYPPTARRPESSSFDDLRAHAVHSLLLRGGEEPAMRLLDRLEREEGDPVVRGYIEEFIASHPTEKLVPRVVDHLLARREFSPGLVRYLATRAKSEQADVIARLGELDLDASQREELTRIVGRLR